MIKDPTFDAVALREAREQRAIKAKADWLARRVARRADPAYRAMRRRRIQRLLRLVMLGKMKERR
ncbi:hypothetical protein R6242_14255 [Iodobacter sp. CM08]|uniref:hypothetical protein n=1 Tax=Iodobacter sp. CM08 TaxID=3085902 RepID=UPI0029811B41|nr:hypothetical protein [Iodobacter sp. CM08]MDW5417729.1 hypothetical protein [Iodobacter sp. CM08]